MYFLSSPIYYPRVSWWEYDFRYRDDLKIEVKSFEDVIDARLTDLRRQAGCVAIFEELKIGQEIKVQVIKFDEATKRVSLGMKQLQQNPWEFISQKYPIGASLKGKVTNITSYGAFVEIEQGIEGLVHVSEMSWLKNNSVPNKFINLGQEVEVMVLDINSQNHRISLFLLPS
jgi:ribosomal protein S1